MRSYDYENNIFDDRPNLACLMTYFHMTFPTFYDRVRLNIFVLLPLSKHPDSESIINHMTTKKLIRINSLGTYNPMVTNQFTVRSLTHIALNSSIKSSEQLDYEM